MVYILIFSWCFSCSGLSKKSDPSSYGDLNRLESEAVIAKRHRSDEQLLEASSKRVEHDQMKLAAAESIDQQVSESVKLTLLYFKSIAVFE